MKRSKSSKRWLEEHFNDPYVKEAKRLGYRSRAAFKLIELQEKHRIIKPGMRVVDLGAAPGGWSQVASDWVGDKGQFYALDILPMESLPGVEFIQGDFTEDAVFDRLVACLDGQKVDCILSDMAPNTSGLKAIDGPKQEILTELAYEFADKTLAKGGSFLVKVFQGQAFEQYLKELRTKFDKVSVKKPKASRDRSPETYLLAIGYK